MGFLDEIKNKMHLGGQQGYDQGYGQDDDYGYDDGYDDGYQGNGYSGASGEGFYTPPGKGIDEARLAYVLKHDDLVRAMRVLAEGIDAYNHR